MIDEGTNRLARLVAIQTSLQTKRLITASELAQRFAVSVRTIYRDIKTLEQAGVPIWTQEGKGYALAEGYRLPPVMFTQAEANALITVEQLVLPNQDTSLVDAYSQAMTKLKTVLRTPVQEKAGFLASRTKIYAQAQLKTGYLGTLQRALTDFQRIQFNYQDASGQPTSRIVEPFALLRSTQENWVLVGWCQLRNAYRFFRLDRMSQLQVLVETFEPPALSLKQFFDSLTQ